MRMKRLDRQPNCLISIVPGFRLEVNKKRAASSDK
jgi:hypothetical protein